MTRPTSTGMSRIAFSRVVTRQLRGGNGYRSAQALGRGFPRRAQGQAPLCAAAG